MPRPSAGIAAALGYEDHERAPADETLAAAARIGRAVDAPLTVDAEAGYGMGATELVAALKAAGAAGCNLEDTDHGRAELRDGDEQAGFLRDLRAAAAVDGYGLVINARIDVFLSAVLAGANEADLPKLLPEALRRAGAYLEAGAECVYPIAL